MDILRLLLGLMLPWAGAYFWLCAAENRFSGQPAHRFRQVGFAFFLGLMAVFGLLQAQSWLSGSVNYCLTIGLLAVFTLAGWLICRTTARVPFPESRPESRLLRYLFWVLATWCALHLLLVGIEIWHRPVFPWDAWQTWVYRAKAWYYAGGFVPFDTPISWELGTGLADYSAAGAHYPTFVSAIAFWAALSLGRWHEAMVNLPTLLCGISLAVAMYGLAREAALSRWVSALAAYLLLSIPLLGTHLALAGQADIWQTAYTGLGLAALLWGIIGTRHWLTGLGLLMVSLGVLVKNEGLVWFLTALALLGLSRRPRWILYGAVTGAILALIAWMTGIDYVELPGLGAIGLAGGRAYMAWLGSVELAMFDLWDDYRANFFLNSSWHLLGPMMMLGAIALVKVPEPRTRNAILALVFLLLLSQLVIFVFSDQGRWAEDWTAINRLPMQVAPVAVLALLVIYYRLSGTVTRPASGGRSWLATVIGLVITLAACVLYLATLYPSTDAEAEKFSAQRLSIVVGNGYLNGERGIINSFENGIAVVSTGRTAIDTSRLPILDIMTAGPNRSARRFFWRNGPGEEDLHSVDIDRGGRQLIHLNSSEGWRGVVSEAGLLFYEDQDRWAEVQSLSLHPRTLGGMLAITWQDWTSVTDWNLQSVNFVSSAAASTPLSLTLVLTSWIAITALSALLLSPLVPAPQKSVALAALSAWLLLDLRWTSVLIDQATRTTAYYRVEPATHLDLGNDKALLALADKVRTHLATSSTPLLIVGESDGLDFETLRTKYHLLPLAAHVVRGATLSSPPRLATDHVLVVRTPALAPGQRRAGATDFRNVLSTQTGRDYEIVHDDPAGVLLRVTRRHTDAK